MNKTKFKANLNRFAAKAPEEGGVSYITNTLCLAGAEHKALAVLCEDPVKALDALDTVAATGGRAEIPAGKQICVLTVKVGDKKHEPQGVIIKKIKLDTRGGECQMHIVYQEPKTNDGCGFYLRNLGADLEVTCVPTEMTIQEEIDEKAKDKAKGGDGDDEE
jgi:hypothetical protein